MASFSLLGLLCLSMTRAAHAQWSVGNGDYTVTKSQTIGQFSVTPKMSAATSCSATLTVIGTATVNYTIKLVWNGATPPIAGATVTASGSVDGQCTNPSTGSTTAYSEVQALPKYKLDVKGQSVNGSLPYSAKPSDTQSVSGLFAQTLTAVLQVQCTNDPVSQAANDNRATAGVGFSAQ